MTGRDPGPRLSRRSPPGAAELAADRASALAMFELSPAAVVRLDRFVDLLLGWQAHTNLIAPSTMPQLWTRHVADSLQVVDLVAAGAAASAERRGPVVVDVGSGGGFPGVVIGCVLADLPGTDVHLVESIQKKAAFLREALHETGTPGVVHAARLEQLIPELRNKPVDYVTARAVAPLPVLLELIAPLVEAGATALLLKGRDLDQELTESTERWHIEGDTVPSRTDAAARILIVHRLSRRTVNGRTSSGGKVGKRTRT